MDKLWVITQIVKDRIAIDNYDMYFDVELQKFCIYTLINDEVKKLGMYHNAKTAENVMKLMDYHLLEVCDKFANPHKYLKFKDTVFHYVSDVFFKMPPIEEDGANEDEESDS